MGDNPLLRDDIPPPQAADGDGLAALVHERWQAIRTYYRRLNVMAFLNVRMWYGDEADQGIGRNDMYARLEAAYRTLGVSCKINFSFGAILEHKTEGTLRYYHTSPNHNAELPGPLLVRTEEELMELFERVDQMDFVERAQIRRPDTRWRVRAVTNITFFMYPLVRAGVVGKPPRFMPEHLRRNKSVTLLKRGRGRPSDYNDNLCFFRCVAMYRACCCPAHRCVCKPPTQNATGDIYREFALAREETCEKDDFEGVRVQDLHELETIFDITIVVFQQDSPENTPQLVWSSGRASAGKSKMYVNLYKNHFSYIRNIQLFSGAYSCNKCSRVFSRIDRLLNHACEPLKVSNLVFSRAAFRPPLTIFNKLSEIGIVFSHEEQNALVNQQRATFDIECMLARSNLPAPTPTTTHTHEHILLSVSVCSNVVGFVKPICFVTDGDSQTCIDQFLKHLRAIAKAATKHNTALWAPVLAILRNKIIEQNRLERRFRESGFSSPAMYRHRKGFSGLRKQIKKYIRRISVVGFNSQKYDINVIRGELVRGLETMEEDIDFVIKKNNSYSCFQTKSFRFLDIINYLAPGYSYEKYLKAFGCKEAKGFFPYEWMDSLDKLEARSLPPKEAFFSALKNEHISDADYQFCLDVWNKANMRTFKEFLVWYNNLDVVPFLEALQKQSEVYAEKGIDMLGSAVSLPGLAVRWAHKMSPAFSSLLPHYVSHTSKKDIGDALAKAQAIQCIDTNSSDLYHLLRENLVGGPSIVFHRYQEADKTTIRRGPYTEKTCKRIVGLDANALYVYCLGSNMPTGYPIRRREENAFKVDPLPFSTSAHCWLTYVEYMGGGSIQHELNGGEVRVGWHGLPVDGVCFETRTVFQFHGCYWHACVCLGMKGKHPTRKTMSVSDIRKDTEAKAVYIRSVGWELVVMRECEWKRFCLLNPQALTFKKSFFDSVYGEYRKPETQKTIIAKIEKCEFYGFVECDIHVPEERLKYFEDMAPIFKNTCVGREHLEPEMLAFAEETDRMRTPQRMLVGSLFGEKILLHTDLLRWYLVHGLVITRIYQTIQYLPRKVYSTFADSVSEARRRGDADPAYELVGTTSKLVGNSFYGKTITNKEKHKRVLYKTSAGEASAAIAGNKFCSLEELKCEVYEIQNFPNEIKVDVPAHIGFTILQLAKLRMLEFYFGCIDRYINREDYQPMETDTDSLYLALAGELEDVIKPELRNDFFRSYGLWFPRQACPLHEELFVHSKVNGNMWTPQLCCRATFDYDVRTPGLFKKEYEGSGMVALNSKTYCCWGEGENDIKLSSKGLSKRSNTLTPDIYKNVLFGKTSHRGVNRGFVCKNNKMLTYSQIKTGLSFLYGKRRVLADGVRTINTTA